MDHQGSPFHLYSWWPSFLWSFSCVDGHRHSRCLLGAGAKNCAIWVQQNTTEQGEWTYSDHLQHERTSKTILSKGKWVKVAQSCLTLWDPMDYYTVRGILHARILEWVAFPFSRGSSRPRNRTGVSCIAGGFFTELSRKPKEVGHKRIQTV